MSDFKDEMYQIQRSLRPHSWIKEVGQVPRNF